MTIGERLRLERANSVEFSMVEFLEAVEERTKNGGYLIMIRDGFRDNGMGFNADQSWRINVNSAKLALVINTLIDEGFYVYGCDRLFLISIEKRPYFQYGVNFCTPVRKGDYA